MKQLKRHLTTISASLLIFFGIPLSIATEAGAATVPNRFYCDPWDNYCYQVNGTYYFGVANECHWKYSGMSGKPHQIHVSSCDRWGPAVA